MSNLEVSIRYIRNILLIVVIILCPLLLGFSVFKILFQGVFSDSREFEETYYEYQTLRYNPSTDETIVGLSTISKYLESDEFISVKRGEWHELTSNFGETEYICRSICYCSPEEVGRRNAGNIARKSKTALAYLLVAVSSYVAVETAKKHFREECEDLLSDYCPLDRIKSENEDCEKHYFDDVFKRFDDIPDDGGNLKPTIENLKGSYVCKGYCVPGKLTTDQRKALGGIDLNLEKDCGGIWFNGRTNFDPEKLLNANYLESALEWFEEKDMKVIDAITLNFAETGLDKFCRSNSLAFERVVTLSKEKPYLAERMQRTVEFAEKNLEVPICYGIRNYDGREKNIFEGSYQIHEKTQCKRLGSMDDQQA